MPANLHHAQELLRRELGRAALPKVAFVSTIEEAVRNADLVIDCVPDELESKLEILWLLDRMAPPRTVFATPTTRLSMPVRPEDVTRWVFSEDASDLVRWEERLRDGCAMSSSLRIDEPDVRHSPAQPRDRDVARVELNLAAA